MNDQRGVDVPMFDDLRNEKHNPNEMTHTAKGQFSDQTSDQFSNISVA